MFTPIQGDLTAGAFRYGIVASRFNDVITRRLTDGAIDCLTRHGATPEQISVLLCPGSFEIPLVARKMVDSGTFDGIICIGAVIRGATPHFDYIAAEVTKGIANLAMESRIPIAFGVLTTDTTEQALERAGLKLGNKGWEAAQTVMEMLNLFAAIDGK
ncbi:MAG: 6,7-dimethyl-8-ribityllumazine synthase [Bacteroidota bacterium]|jgi:6,7-dimethyl-8-ribityllumazine synthase|nr:6,7-dimethyl-8-ribityllumazine synthase [Bacteroidota bacterium]